MHFALIDFPSYNLVVCEMHKSVEKTRINEKV